MTGPLGHVFFKGIEGARVPVLDGASVFSLVGTVVDGGAEDGSHCLMVAGGRIGAGRTSCGCQCMPDGVGDEDRIQPDSFASGEQGGVHIRRGATSRV